jgi:hypothetical protein
MGEIEKKHELNYNQNNVHKSLLNISRNVMIAMISINVKQYTKRLNTTTQKHLSVFSQYYNFKPH